MWCTGAWGVSQGVRAEGREGGIRGIIHTVTHSDTTHLHILQYNTTGNMLQNKRRRKKKINLNTHYSVKISSSSLLGGFRQKDKTDREVCEEYHIKKFNT